MSLLSIQSSINNLNNVGALSNQNSETLETMGIDLGLWDSMILRIFTGCGGGRRRRIRVVSLKNKMEGKRRIRLLYVVFQLCT
ncbi:hypothetical protein L2E82_18860 [Cichorium intybus]|uniref:Uncharacterized protein n=1 Tax=Cichorium intybus TaxID=13427 RepID=A0ACB9FBM4_CICIN|nr:hypothetical protein L2E82_18860 [Cichorium intybus]